MTTPQWRFTGKGSHSYGSDYRERELRSGKLVLARVWYQFQRLGNLREYGWRWSVSDLPELGLPGTQGEFRSESRAEAEAAAAGWVARALGEDAAELREAVKAARATCEQAKLEEAAAVRRTEEAWAARQAAFAALMAMAGGEEKGEGK